MYPQYWTWRLSGALIGECTSLGCHTDLWATRAGDYSSLVKERGWLPKFPRVVPAWESPACLREAVMRATGLPGADEMIRGTYRRGWEITAS